MKDQFAGLAAVISPWLFASLLIVVVLPPKASSQSSANTSTDGTPMRQRGGYRARLSALRDSFPLIRVGELAPRITGVTPEGDTASAPATDAVYFFSFVKCAPCKSALKKIAKRGFEMREGRQLVYVNPIDSIDAIAAYWTRYPAHTSVLKLGVARDVARAFGVLGYPTFIEVDKEGRVVQVGEPLNKYL